MAEGLLSLKAPIAAGEPRPFSDRVYALERIVEAHHCVEQGHKRGNVASTVAAAGTG